jgi:hypothetical protein
MVGTVSRTARVSGVTRNLKEAAGKVPARRTETAYEAATSGRGCQVTQSPIAIREDVVVNAAGKWDEGHASYLGRSVNLPRASCTVRFNDGVTEVSRRHISWPDQSVKD